MKYKTDKIKHTVPDENDPAYTLALACARAGETLGLCRSLFDNPNLSIRDAFPDETTRKEVLARIDEAGRLCDEAVERYEDAKKPGSN